MSSRGTFPKAMFSVPSRKPSFISREQSALRHNRRHQENFRRSRDQQWAKKRVERNMTRFNLVKYDIKRKAAHLLILPTVTILTFGVTTTICSSVEKIGRGTIFGVPSHRRLYLTVGPILIFLGCVLLFVCYAFYKNIRTGKNRLFSLPASAERRLSKETDPTKRQQKQNPTTNSPTLKKGDADAANNVNGCKGQCQGGTDKDTTAKSENHTGKRDTNVASGCGRITRGLPQQLSPPGYNLLAMVTHPNTAQNRHVDAKVTNPVEKPPPPYSATLRPSGNPLINRSYPGGLIDISATGYRDYYDATTGRCIKIPRHFYCPPHSRCRSMNSLQLKPALMDATLKSVSARGSREGTGSLMGPNLSRPLEIPSSDARLASSWGRKGYGVAYRGMATPPRSNARLFCDGTRNMYGQTQDKVYGKDTYESSSPSLASKILTSASDASGTKQAVFGHSSSVPQFGFFLTQGMAQQSLNDSHHESKSTSSTKQNEEDASSNMEESTRFLHGANNSTTMSLSDSFGNAITSDWLEQQQRSPRHHVSDAYSEDFPDWLKQQQRSPRHHVSEASSEDFPFNFDTTEQSVDTTDYDDVFLNIEEPIDSDKIESDSLGNGSGSPPRESDSDDVFYIDSSFESFLTSPEIQQIMASKITSDGKETTPLSDNRGTALFSIKKDDHATEETNTAVLISSQPSCKQSAPITDNLFTKESLNKEIFKHPSENLQSESAFSTEDLSLCIHSETSAHSSETLPSQGNINNALSSYINFGRSSPNVPNTSINTGCHLTDILPNATQNNEYISIGGVQDLPVSFKASSSDKISRRCVRNVSTSSSSGQSMNSSSSCDNISVIESAIDAVSSGKQYLDSNSEKKPDCLVDAGNTSVPLFS